jgi:hypothetical protein
MMIVSFLRHRNAKGAVLERTRVRWNGKQGASCRSKVMFQVLREQNYGVMACPPQAKSELHMRYGIGPSDNFQEPQSAREECPA